LGNDILSGGSRRDRFVLTAGSGPNLITDFTKGEDLLVLAIGLTFAQLKYYPKRSLQLSLGLITMVNCWLL
jgi:hypothetical protein